MIDPESIQPPEPGLAGRGKAAPEKLFAHGWDNPYTPPTSPLRSPRDAFRPTRAYVIQEMKAFARWMAAILLLTIVFLAGFATTCAIAIAMFKVEDIDDTALPTIGLGILGGGMLVAGTLAVAYRVFVKPKRPRGGKPS